MIQRMMPSRKKYISIIFNLYSKQKEKKTIYIKIDPNEKLNPMNFEVVDIEQGKNGCCYAKQM